MEEKEEKVGVYFRLEGPIKKHVDRYVFELTQAGKLDGGLAALIRKLLVKETKYQAAKLKD